MNDSIREKYELWLKMAVADPDLLAELKTYDDASIEEAFYSDLSFGTAGLRGVIGAGTNRMNVYTVALASKAMAEFVAKKGTACKSVAIAYDSRIKSELFARTAAETFASEGVKVYLYPELMPTPCLSFAVRYFHASAGVMVTASHNPAKYNGYKAYGADGCQMTENDAGFVYECMKKLDPFRDLSFGGFDEYVRNGMIAFIGPEVTDAYLSEVKKQSVLPPDAAVDRSVSIVYTPLNGAGRVPVLRVLRECGFTNVTVVKEQEMPDGNFPTCTYPNPEIPATMALGVEYCKRYDADLLIATDPDSDRTSIAVKLPDLSYRILSGNELGCLLLDYILSMKKRAGTLPKNGIAVKSIVTTDMAAAVAKEYGIETRNVLTGFKYIGEQIRLLEEKGEEDRYLFGFEESCGFLAGTYVRDKDAVVASMLVAEMFVFEKSLGSDLAKKLDGLYRKYGYYRSEVLQYEYPGIEGKQTMREILSGFREGVSSFAGVPVKETKDYLGIIDGLPKADVLKFALETGESVIIRPSGTEPKIKVYITSSGRSEKDAKDRAERFRAAVEDRMKRE
ncbi:MAG: phospho-sugar mutase [Lachnospiraceae bacterium]|nr:phospho-sugar mutase [Lachnospiraceae bacterium]